jgi:hypothetical protein
MHLRLEEVEKLYPGLLKAVLKGAAEEQPGRDDGEAPAGFLNEDESSCSASGLRKQKNRRLVDDNFGSVNKVTMLGASPKHCLDIRARVAIHRSISFKDRSMECQLTSVSLRPTVASNVLWGIFVALSGSIASCSKR